MAKQHPAAAVAALCEALPEVEAATSHGMPIWKARGKPVAILGLDHHGDGRVGLLPKLPPGERHRLVDSDPGVSQVPACSGRNGWIELDPEAGVDRQEIERLARERHRHFATKGALRVLDGG